MAQPYLSLEKAKQSVRDAVANSPWGSRNPVGESNRCLYDDGLGGHCVVGQVFVDNGIPLPEPDDMGIGFLSDYVRKGYYSAETQDFLSSVQANFDGDIEATPTWRQALSRCESEGLL